MTVHHQKYYMDDNVPPADWDDPIPVPFISATGKYLIALAASDMEESNRKGWFSAIFDLLELALKEEGVGAKTSSGYGRMTLGKSSC
jgi:CRISPR-associated protein Cmr6